MRISIDSPKPESFQLQGSFAPDSLTMLSAPGPRFRRATAHGLLDTYRVVSRRPWPGPAYVYSHTDWQSSTYVYAYSFSRDTVFLYQ